MCVIRLILLKSCIFGMYILVTEASVLLQTFDGEKAYLKDTTVTLVCTITPYNNVMTWYVDNDPYADCFLGTCGPSSNKPYTFKFDFDETAGVFNLTIDSVNSAHAQLSFACDDGNVRETISFNVTPDKGQNPSSTTHTSNSPTKPGINNQITVTSEHNNDNGDSPVSTGGIIGIVIGIVVFLIFVACLIIFGCTRKKKGTIEQNDAAQNYGGNGTETVQERPNALTNSVGESSIGSKDVIEVWNGTETVQVQPNAFPNSVEESSIGSKDGIEVWNGTETVQVQPNALTNRDQWEMKNNILVWMTDVHKFFIMMKKAMKVLSEMKDQRQNKLCQKIEKDIKTLHGLIKDEDNKVTNKAKREQLLRKERELIEKSNWTKEQGNTYGDEEQKRDIKTLHTLIKDEDNEGKRVFSSFIMQVLQEDKAAYDKIKQVINRANADHLKSTMMIEDLLR